MVMEADLAGDVDRSIEQAIGLIRDGVGRLAGVRALLEDDDARTARIGVAKFFIELGTDELSKAQTPRAEA